MFSPEKIDKGLFSKAYTTFLITTQPQLHKVRKRYTDFEWLKNILSLHYPYTLIPPLPKKNFDKRFNESFLAKRMHSLENFLNYLLQNPLIKNSTILTDFLTIANENEFNTKQTSYNLKQAPKTTKDLLTISGKVKVNFNGDHETGIQNIRTYSEMNNTLFDQLSIEYKALYNEMLSISERLLNISNIWNDLYKHTIKFNDNDDIKEAFKAMSKITEKWSKCEQKQAEIIKGDIRDYFNFVNKEFLSMKNLCLQVENVKYNYYKESERLGNKKEELFRKGDTDKWELKEEDENRKNELIGDKQLAIDKMLPKESQQLEELKSFYGATINSVIEEYERHQILSGINHANIISNYCRKQMSELNSLQSSLGSGIAHLFEFTTKTY